MMGGFLLSYGLFGGPDITVYVYICSEEELFKCSVEPEQKERKFVMESVKLITVERLQLGDTSEAVTL